MNKLIIPKLMSFKYCKPMGYKAKETVIHFANIETSTWLGGKHTYAHTSCAKYFDLNDEAYIETIYDLQTLDISRVCKKCLGEFKIVQESKNE